MAAFLSKYGVARTIQIPVIKRAVVDFAVGADWTPAAGDVKITKDGGAAANVTNLPTALAMGNAALWVFSLTATEMQAARVEVTVADAATKAVEDQAFAIETYGNASAQHAADLSDSVRLGLTALPNAAAEAAGGLYTRGTGAGQIKQTNNGEIDSNSTHVNNVATTSVTTVSANVGTTQPVNFTGTGASALVKGDTVDIAGAAVSASTAQIGVNVVNFGGSAGTFASGRPEVNVTHLLGTAWLTPGTAGTPDVNVKLWNGLATVALPLIPTVAGRTLDVSAGGEAGVDWANVGTPGSTVNLSATTVNLTNTATTVTNQLTAAAIATGVWQDTTAGDFTVASSIGKSLYTSGVVPGASGGLFISGTNSGTTTLGAFTVSGATTLTGAVTATNASNSIKGIAVTATGLDLVAASSTFTQAVTDAVLDELLSGHAVPGSVGAGISAAGSAGDPWSTALPGAYGAGTAGAILGSVPTNLSGQLSTIDGDVLGGVASVNGNIAALNNITAADVWAAGTRTLTAGTNIVLAKGVGVTGFNDIAAGAAMTLTAGERTAILAAILAGVLKGTYTIQDALKDLAALSGNVTNTGADYTIPATGWGAGNTKITITDNGSGNRTVVRS